MNIRTGKRIRAITRHGIELRLNTITSLVLLACSSSAVAGEVFNLKLLQTGPGQADTQALKQFANNGGLIAGTYRVDITINRNRIDRKDVNFVYNAKLKQLFPEFTKADYVAMGVKADGSPAFHALASDAIVENLADYIPDSKVSFEENTLRLNISVPQIAVNANAMGYVDPHLWDDGLPMAFMNYSYSGAQNWRHNNGDNETDQSNYLSLTNGINVGPWRLRNDSSYSQDSGWQNINTYAWRNITALTSKLTVGDSWTDSDVFDSIQFRGAKLESNDNMLPYSLRGFAPVIHGVTKSNAQVTVRQNGYIIYQSYVSPGPFEIRDLNQVNSGGDMEVTVKESDGSENSYIQASASVPIMRREGSLKYSVVGGKYRSSDDTIDTPDFAQGTLIYGLPWGITVYGGAQGAADYNAQAIGAGIDLGSIGSLSSDVTTAQTTRVGNESRRGQSYRFQYAKDFVATSTNMTLASYRYSTSDYYTFEEALTHNKETGDDNDTFAYRNDYTRHRRLQLTISQSLSDYGQLYLSGYQQDYWNLTGKERSLNAGYSYSWERMSFNANYSLTRTPQSSSDQQFALSVNIPLDKWLPGARVSYTNNASDDGRSRQYVSLSGTALDDKNLTYSVGQSYGNKGVGYGGNVGGGYRSSIGNINASYSYDNNSEQLNYGVQGAIVMHPYGVTLAQSLGDASVLVRAPGVKGLGVTSGTAVYTDARGYSVIPYASTFQRNTISIKTRSLASNAEIQMPSQEVIPTEGALVLANFDTRIGKRLLVNVMYHGASIPFGAVISASEGNFSTLAGENGQVYLTGVNDGDVFIAKWGKNAGETCRIALTPSTLSGKQTVSNLYITAANCE
ncbi:fimbria/pilus outer membrane usher protein [[Enterobacter] lignolyticus]|uniref:Fimbrial biogenesis outer membrane usher protein n=1 Tax=Enterobacter lignolyticus (strain SCF1) TaxID=701347 RepID=E3GBG6_ENTLS|nr:fimbria/pilus outer membrane usher protein [[Enterobacter] lignolyticus]ADO48929.1 fimbrial biogenesis outer membrane usher protein [[Enterobacter] lignolyticus SCF1]